MIVLLLNDHVLKHAWPGFLTGKLSDVAGLVVAAPLVALILLRRADFAATILTGALFALVKTTETGAEVASVAWTTLAGPSRVLADPVDLLALPALGLAWWVRQRSREQVAVRWRVLTAVPLAVLAVTATAAAPEHDEPMPPGTSVRLLDGVIVIDSRYASEDGGRTWHDWTDLDTGPYRPQRAACLREHCYRLVEGRMRVLRSGDGGRTWAVDWDVPPADVERLATHVDERRGRHPAIASTSLVVQERPGGHVVVVANRHDGVAVRDVDGTWRRFGFAPGGGLTESAAVPLDRPAADGDAMLVAGLAAVWAALLALAVQARRTGSWAVVVLGGLGALLLAPFPYERISDQLALVGGFTLVCVVVAAGGFVSQLASRGTGRAVAVGVLTGLCVAAPVKAWSVGWLDHGVAVTVAAVAAPVACVTGAAVLRYLTGSSTSRPT